MTDRKPEEIPIIEPPAREDFSQAPVSITELRSHKEQRCDRWTPRDVLIRMLRGIDSGEINPDALIVIYRDRLADGETATHFSLSAPDIHVAGGLIHRAGYLINQG